METEKRLISSFKLVTVLAKTFRNGIIHYDDLMATIADIPTVNAVEVVRCKACAVPHNKWTGCPKLNGLVPPPDFYCAYGERREGE